MSIDGFSMLLFAAIGNRCIASILAFGGQSWNNIFKKTIQHGVLGLMFGAIERLDIH